MKKAGALVCRLNGCGWAQGGTVADYGSVDVHARSQQPDASAGMTPRGAVSAPRFGPSSQT